jgi:cell fate (sporulation/competence/biofilm development) regulator YmcA (YheA/YmcA/DUF963 family)
VSNIALYKQLEQVLANQEKIMTALTDLKAADVNIENAVAAAVADIAALSAKLSALPSVDDADAATITADLNTLATNLTNAVTPPPVAPAPIGQAPKTRI